MQTSLKPNRRKSSSRKYVPGTRWNRNQLSRARSYELETLEPRYLLSANLYDPADGVLPGGPVVANTLEANITSSFDQLARMGNILDSDAAITADTKETVLPFFGDSIEGLMGFKVSQLFSGDNGSDTYSSIIGDAFAGGNIDSGDLATALNTFVQGEFGAGASVSDAGSTNAEMTLSFTFDLAKSAQSLVFGDEAQEFYLKFGTNANAMLDFKPIQFEFVVDLTDIDNTSLSVLDNPLTTAYNENLNADTADGNRHDDTDYHFAFGSGSNNTFSIDADSAHSAAIGTDPLLTNFGIGFGLIQAWEGAGTAGGKISNTGGTLDFNLNMDFTIDSGLFTGGKLRLDTMKGVSDWSGKISIDKPVSGIENQGELFLPVDVINPAGDQFISGFDGITGSFTFTNDSLFDGRAALVQTDNTLASFSRILPEDLLRFVEGTASVLGQTEQLEELQAFLPFLDLTLGEAYGYGDAANKALYDPLRTVTNLITAVNAPSTTGDPVDYSGTAGFTITLATAGAMSNKAISVTGATSLEDLKNKLNTAFAAGTDISAFVQARLSGGNSPRIELVAPEATDIFLNNFSGDLDIGFEQNGLVFARNNGTISAGGVNGNKFTWDGVNIDSSAGFDVTAWDTLETFTIQVGSDAAVTVTVPPSSFYSVTELALYIQAQVAEAGLYDVNANTGVTVSAVQAGTGFGLQFTHTDGISSLTIAGSAASKFNLAAATGTTVASNAQVAVSPFNMDGTPISFDVEVKRQQDGTLSTETATVSIPAQDHTTFEGLLNSIRSAFSAAGITDFLQTSGVLVDLVRAPGGGVGLSFYGSPEVYEITLSGVAADMAKLGLSGASFTSTAPFIELEVTEGTGASASTNTTKVYLNGNTTMSYFSDEVNSSVENVVSDIKSALERAGLLNLGNTGANTGVDFRAIGTGGGGLTENLEFYALNAGSGDNQISAIATLAGSAAVSHLNLSNKPSESYSVATKISRPNFDSVQTFVERLNTAVGVPHIKVQTNAAGTGLSFTPWTANAASILILGQNPADTSPLDLLQINRSVSPVSDYISDAAIDLNAWSTATTAERTLVFSAYNAFTVRTGRATIELPQRSFTSLSDLAQTIQGLLQAEAFNEGLLTSPAVYNAGDLLNGVSPYFDFPIRFYFDENSQSGGGLADLTDVQVRFDSDYGRTETGLVSGLSSTDVQTVSRSTDVSLTLGVDLIQPDAAGGNLEFILPVLDLPNWDGTITDDFVLNVTVDGAAPVELRVASSDISGAPVTVQDFVDALNAQISAQGLGAVIAASFATDDQNTTAPGDDITLLRIVSLSGMANRILIEAPNATPNSARTEMGLASSYFPTTESLVVELPVLIAGWDGQLTLDSRLQIVLDDGVNRDVLVTAADIIAYQSSGTPDFSTLDYIAVLNQKLAAMSYGSGNLSDILLFELDTVNNFARDVIRLVAAPGATRSLMVRVPEYAVDLVQVQDEASDKLGFTTTISPAETRTDFFPPAVAASADLDITSFFTGFVLTQDLSMAITLPDGTTRAVRILASDTSGNADWGALGTDIINALAAAGITDVSVALSGVGPATSIFLEFTGAASATSVWRVEAGRDIYYGTATDAIIADQIFDSAGAGATNSIGFELETDAFFTVKLPDGTFDVIQVEAADSVGAASLADLVEVIQNAILANRSFSDSGIRPKIDVSEVGGKIQFDLNDSFYPNGGTWNLQVGTAYEEGKSNAARFELLFADETAVESQYAVVGPISGKLVTTSDFRLSNNLTFDISINGTDYETVTVLASATTTNTTIGDLVADINAALAAKSVTVGTGNNAGDFVSAGVIANATRIQIRMNDNAPVDVLSVRFDPGSSATNSYVSELGFPDFETRIGMRGSDPRLSGLNLIGSATVESGTAAGQGSFGYIDFDFGSADVNLQADSELRLGGVTRLQDVARALSGYRAEYEANAASPFSVDLGVLDSTYAKFELQNLSFPGDSVTGQSITNLSFAANATILMEYALTGGGVGSRIGVAGTTFTNPGRADITFTNTDSVELLSRIRFIDVVGSLWRVGDMLSDWMNNDPNGAFKQKLFFAESGLVDIYDFGQAFNQVVDEISLNPPENLQELARSLSIGLQIDAADIAISLKTSGSGSTYDAAINIAFELVRTVTATLPLFVDLATLRGRSINAGLVEQSLLGMNSLSGNPTNPMEVEFSALSKLILDMDLQLVEDGVVIEPKPVLNQPASGSMFETKFHLNGDSYTSDIPAGANNLRLGYSWLDNEGNEVVAPGDLNIPINATLATTRPLTGVTYDDTVASGFATLTSDTNGKLTLDGTDVQVGDIVLIKDQADAAQNGVYTVINTGSAGAAWQLSRYNSLENASELDWVKVFIGAGTKYANKGFMIKAIPTVDVVAHATANLAAGYQDFTQNADPSDDHFLPLLTASGNGALSLGGVSPAVGDFVLLSGQTDPDRNGVYQVINLGSGAAPWKLVQMDIGKSTLGKASYNNGTTVSEFQVLKNAANNDISVTAAPAQPPYHVVELRASAVAINETGEVALPDANGTPAIYDTEAVTVDPDLIVAPIVVEVSTTEALNATFTTTSSGRLTANANGVISIDGQALALNDLVLVNHQADGVQNGIYQVTAVGSASATWQLTRDTSFNSIGELSSAKISITSGTYAGERFLQSETLASTLNDSVVRFSRLIAPASFQLNLNIPNDPAPLGTVNAVQSKQLPYQLTVATTGSIDTTPAGANAIAEYIDPATGSAYIEGLANGSINSIRIKAWDPISDSEISLPGIDGYTAFQVGDRILVKDQFRDTSADPATQNYQGHYQNGIYEVVSVGGVNTKWRIQRVDFADDTDNAGAFNANEMIELRASILRGLYGGDTRWIQTNAQLTALSAGQNVKFSDEIASIYGHYDVNGTLKESWFDLTAVGEVAATLPLTVILVPEGGGETIISKDLGSLTDNEKKTLGLMGSSIIYADLYESMPDLPTLQMIIPDDAETVDTAFTGSGLAKFFNTSLIAVEFTELPDLLRTVPPSDVLSQLRDWAYLGDALDLALFNLQFAMDRALGIEVPLLGINLPRYASFIEEFRDDLTTQIRERVRLDPLKPTNAIRDALFAALGPNGIGYLTSASDIGIHVEGQNWNIAGSVASGDYGLTPEGLEFEAITGTAVEFSFNLVKGLDTDATAVNINSIQSGDESLGLSISNQTVVINPTTNQTTSATGGVHLRRSFEFNFGFGLDVRDGFYAFNPTKNDASSANDEAVITVGLQAELDGDINTAGVQEFNQLEFTSQINLLSVRISDGRAALADQPGGDSLHSGYFGTYALDFNIDDSQLATGSHNRVGRNNIGVNVDQLRRNEVLAPEDQTDGLLNFIINADADIHLMMESKLDGLIPSYQTDFIYSKRFGTGYLGLVFTDVLTGLGDSTLGGKVHDDIADTNNEILTTAEWGSVSPAWRIDRSALTANGQEGSTFVAFQNISIDVEGYLTGPVYDTVKWFDNTFEKIRPFITFMTTPIPGTEWMAQPVTLGTFLGAPFAIFVAVINSIDKVLGQIPPSAGYNDRQKVAPRVGMGGSHTGIQLSYELEIFENSNKKASDRYKQARADREFDRDIRKLEASNFEGVEFTENPLYKDKVWNENPLYEGSSNNIVTPEEEDKDNRSRLKKLSESIQEKTQTPNKFSQKFESFRDGSFYDPKAKPDSVGGKVKQAFKKTAADGLKANDDRGGKKDIGPSLTGGGFQLDALRADTAINIFRGNNSDLLRISIPKLEVTFTYTRFFPLPAFPPLGLTVGFSMSVFIQLSFGWDTTGFYWTTKDANAATLAESERVPTFGFTFGFTVGVALNFGFAEVGVEAFLTIGVEFYWNTPEGSDKLRQDEIAWLQDEGISLFDVRVYAEIGVRIYLDFIIPIPLVGPITIRVFQLETKTYIFDETIDIESGYIQLAEIEAGGVLRLNMGRYADERMFIDTDGRNEVFNIYQLGGSAGGGEDVLVEYVGASRSFYSKYTGIKEIYGYVGIGATRIDAGGTKTVGEVIKLDATNDSRGGTDISVGTVLTPLEFAAVSFIGGTGSTYLRAGQSYNTAFGRSLLQGGTTSATLVGGSTGMDFVAGDGNSIVLGSTGADNIVSKAGSDILRGNGGGDTFYFNNDFGRDRLYVTGTGNRVDFGGTVLNGHAGPVNDVAVAANFTDGVKFQFGQLVQSVKQGLNTAFFAVDPSGADSIDTWVGTDGDDIFNVFHFSPNKTLNIDGGLGNNFYNVFLGDPKKVYDKDPAVNRGTININDAEGANSRLLLNQLFADTISYNSTEVTNGRERMGLTDIERIDLNAGDSTLIWGANPGASGYEEIVGGNVTTGRIIIAGDVQLTGFSDVELNLIRTLDVAHNLVIANANSGGGRDLTVNITNPNPLLTSDLYVGSGAGIFLTQGTGVGTLGNGFGTITLNAYTGSIDNSPAESGGKIQAQNGFLEMSARDSIGSTGNPLFIDVARVSAETTGRTNFSGLQGIFLTSDQDINVRAALNKAGLTTVDGQIYVEVTDTNSKLTYSDILAGSGRDITIVADTVELAGAYSVTEETTSQVTSYVPVVSYTTVYQYVPVPYVVDYFFYTQTYFIYLYLPINIPITSYVPVTRTVITLNTTNVAAGSGSISGTGQLVMLNYTDDLGITVADGAPTPATPAVPAVPPTVGPPATPGIPGVPAVPAPLSLTKSVLDSWSDGFSNIVIGRNFLDTKHTGLVDIHNYAFQDPITFRGGSIKVGEIPAGVADPGKLTSPDVINLDAYDHDNTDATFIGDVRFNPATVMESQSITVKSDADMLVQGQFTSTAATDGLLLFQAGNRDNTGNVTLAGNFIANGNGSDLRAITGSTSGDILLGSAATFTVEDLVSLRANEGSITQQGASRITVDNLEVIASNDITVKTDINNLINALITKAGSFTIDENDGLNVTRVKTFNGAINLKIGTAADAAGTGDLLFTNPDSLGGTVSNLEAGGAAGAGTGNVVIESAGAVKSGVAGIDAGEWHVIASSLVVDSKKEIDLITDLQRLTARTASGAAASANITISNTGLASETFLLEEITTQNGQININNSHDMQADLVQTNTLPTIELVTNGITLTTDTGKDGTIYIGEVKTRGNTDATPGGHANVNISADGSVLEKTTGTSLITGRDLFVTAFGTVPSLPGNVIDINVSLRELTAKTLQLGDVKIESADDLIIRLVESTGATGILGDFRAFVTNAATDPNLSIERIDAGSKDVYLTVDGNIVDLDTQAKTKITANELYVNAGGNVALDTGIDELYANIGGTGTLTLQESDSVILAQVLTAGGRMDITTGIDDANPNDLVVLTSGNALIGEVRAGTGSDQAITINTIGGAVQKYTGAYSSSTITPGPSLLEGGLFIANTFRGVGDVVTTLDVDVISMVANTRQPGGIYLNETDDITLSDLDVVDGSIFVDAGGNIVHDQVLARLAGAIIDLDAQGGTISVFDANSRITGSNLILRSLSGTTAQTIGETLTAYINGPAGDITVRENNSIIVKEVNTPSGKFDLTVGTDGTPSRIDVDPAVTLPTPHVTATDMILTTQKGVALSSNFMNAAVSNIWATVSIDGGIFINNLIDVDLKNLFTQDGMIHITGDANVTATNVRTFTDNDGIHDPLKQDNKIIIDTSTGGNVIINTIIAGAEAVTPGQTPPKYAAVEIISGGSINAVDPATRLTNTNVVGKEITFDAQTGVGNTQELLLTTDILNSKTVTGNVGIINSSLTPTQVNNISTGSGNISFQNNSPANTNINNLSTGSGNILTTHLGGGDLTVQNMGTGSGNIVVLVGGGATFNLFNSRSQGGNTLFSADEMNFFGGANSISGTGSFTVTPFTPGINVEIYSPLGGTGAQRENFLELTQREMDAIDQGFSNIFVGGLGSGVVSQYLNYNAFDFKSGNSIAGNNNEGNDGAGGGSGFFAADGVTPNFTYGYQPLFELLNGYVPNSSDPTNKYDDEDSPFFFEFTKTANGLSSEEYEAFLDQLEQLNIADNTPDATDDQSNVTMTLAGVLLLPMISGSKVVNRVRKGVKKMANMMSCFF